MGMVVQDTDDGKGVKVVDVDDEGTAFKAGIKETILSCRWMTKL
jgi:serine protease Do